MGQIRRHMHSRDLIFEKDRNVSQYYRLLLKAIIGNLHNRSMYYLKGTQIKNQRFSIPS